MDAGLRQYGVAVLPLGRLVRNFCLEQGNMNEAMFIKNLKHAEWVWKEIFRESLWSIKTAALTMCDRQITLPDDCERLINISVVDSCRRLHPLTFDSDLNTAKVNCVQNSCSCTNCGGESSLCGALDNITMTTEAIDIQGTDYTKTTWVRHNGCGDIEEVTSTPTYDAANDTVVYITSRQMLCQVEVDTRGCIKATQPNFDVLIKYCGCSTSGSHGVGIFGWGDSVYGAIIPPVYNYWGYYNFNAADPNIVHIFRNDRYSRSENCPSWAEIGTILVSYRTNGATPGQEILVPEYAYDAMTQGIVYRQRKLAPRDGDRDGSFFNMFRREKMKVFKYLNPINMDQIEKLHTQPKKW